MQSSRRSNVTRVPHAASVWLKTRFLANKINHEYVTSALTGQKMSGFFSLCLPITNILLVFCLHLSFPFRRPKCQCEWATGFRPNAWTFGQKRMFFFGELVRQLSLLFCFRNRHHFYCGVVFVVFIFAPTESENTSILRQKARNLFACRNACWLAAACWHNHRCNPMRWVASQLAIKTG